VGHEVAQAVVRLPQINCIPKNKNSPSAWVEKQRRSLRIIVVVTAATLAGSWIVINGGAGD